MPDWQELVRQCLSELELDAAEKEEVQAELAAHLEESYERFCMQGLAEKEASHRTLEQVSDWKELRRKISAAKRRERPMKKRAQQLWVPGFLTLILAMVFLTVFLKLGFRPRIVGSGSGAVFFYAPWLASLPFVGALAAHLSFRGGGSRSTAFLASCFPVLALAAAFLLMFPLGMVIERVGGSQGDFGVVATTLLGDGVGWLLLPGAALLAGAAVVGLLFGERSTSQTTTIGQRGANA